LPPALPELTLSPAFTWSAALLLLATAVVGGAAAAWSASAPQDAADLVLRHGTFYPVSPAGSVRGSLAVRGGRITYLGEDAGVERWIGPKTQVIELGGRAVTPGLIDAHSHLGGLGAALESVDLRGVASYEEVVRRVAAASAKAPAGAWVFGRGWDQNLWPTKAFPDHHPLSAAVPDHPVLLDRIDGHAILVNAAAMRAVGLDAHVADPQGGRIERDEKGEPTGVLVDNAEDLVTAKLPPPTAEQLRRRLENAGHAAAAVGLTTVSDLGIDEDAADAYRELQSTHGLPVRVAAFWTGVDPRLPQWLAAGPWASDDRFLSLRGVKLYADGALGSRGAALLEPYDDDPKNVGLLVNSGENLERLARQVLAAGFQLGIHAIGDRGNLVAIDAIEAAFDGRPHPEARWRIEHVQIAREQDLARMAKLGIIASMQPTHATSDMPWVPARIGQHRLPRAYAWRTALKLGARLALGSDFPVEKPDPLLGFYAAVTRQDVQGKPPGGWLPDQVLTREEALRGFTLDAAWSLFLDDQVGSLEVGKRADLVVFDRDPMTVAVAEIPRTLVDWTLVDGRVAFHREGAR